MGRFGPLLALLVLGAAVYLPQLGPKPAAAPSIEPQLVGGQGECKAAAAPGGACSRRPAGQRQRVRGPPEAQVGTPLDGGLLGSTYIVRFKEYRMADEHRRRLERALAGRGVPWRWQPRHNAASAFPTDFGLVQLGEPAEGAKEQLARLSFVRDVHPDRQLTQSLLAAGGEQLPGVPQQQQQQQQQQPGEEGDSSSSGYEYSVQKRPGRMQTRPTFSLEDNVDPELDSERGGGPSLELSHRIGNDSVAVQRQRRRALLSGGQSLPVLLGADKIWEQGFRGQRVKMGVFDTGIRGDHPHVKNIRERTNWTHEPTLDDGLGHGSFVAGVIASTDASCPGLAPEVELYTFRVFTNDQVSYTSWFLDAFNYAIATQMDVVNLSIGGPDFLDEPFVEKVLEITSNGILMVSAIGNDGPLYGTLNNPADQNDVIGVGGIDFQDKIASFSSRGMSTWELPLGYGRAKPDVMAYGREVQGSRINGGCRTLSGTSVASPVVAGAVCLLASVVPEEKRWELLNPASMKQALVEGAVRIPDLNMYEQGQGKINVLASKEILASYVPRASIVPSKLDLTDCPYMWPFCQQPLYAGAMPTMFNATVLNGMGLTGKLEGVSYRPTDAGGELLDIRFEFSDMLWPWSGFLALYIQVKPEGAAFNGTASGEISFTVVSPPRQGQKEAQSSKVTLPLTAAIIPTPPRQKRVLWDQFHSIRYPPAYFPRDDLQVRHDILDWHGDHPHTNFHDMYNYLRENGYFLEILGSPLTCFNASEYGALMIVDSEDEFYQEEISKLEHDVRHLGLGLIIFAEWYDEETMAKLRFYDDNTRSWWEAATGGANVPALNDLLVPYGAAFGSGVLDGNVQFSDVEGFKMASGTRIAAFPAGGHLHRTVLAAKQGSVRGQSAEEPILGLLNHGAGRLALYGDSNCLDSSHQRSNCFDLLRHLLEFATEGGQELLTAEVRLTEAFGSYDKLPERRSDYDFWRVSPVLNAPLRCYPNSPAPFHGQNFSQWAFNMTRPPMAVAAASEGGEQAGAEGGSAAAPGNSQAAAAAGAGGPEQAVEVKPAAASAAQAQPQPAAGAAAAGGGGAGAASGTEGASTAQQAAVEAAKAAQQAEQKKKQEEEAAAAAAAQKAAQEAASAAAAAAAAAQKAEEEEAAAQKAAQEAAAQKAAQAAAQKAAQAAAQKAGQEGAAAPDDGVPEQGGAAAGASGEEGLAAALSALPVRPSSAPAQTFELGPHGGERSHQLGEVNAALQLGTQGGKTAAGLGGGGEFLGSLRRVSSTQSVVSASQLVAVAGLLLVACLWSVARRRRRLTMLAHVPLSPSRRLWWRSWLWGGGREAGRDV